MSKKYLLFSISSLIILFLIGAGIYFYSQQSGQTKKHKTSEFGFLSRIENLELAYLFRQNKGNKIKDFSGQENSGTCIDSESCPKIVTKNEKSFAKFDGENDWIKTGLDLNQSSQKAELTFAGWVKPAKSGGWFFNTDNGGHDWSLGINGDPLKLKVDTGYGRWAVEKTIKPNEWTYVAVTWDRDENQATAYINNDKFTHTGVDNDNDDNKLAIGRSQYNGGCCYFQGSLDDILVASSTLSQSQIKRHRKIFSK